MPGSFIIPFRLCTGFVASEFEGKRLRFAPFSTTEILEKVLQYGKWYCCSHRYTTNILTTEITNGYEPVTPR